MSVWDIASKLEITELLYRYAELIDAGDFDGVGRLLGRGNFMGVAGVEKIAALFVASTRRYPEHGNTPRTRHLVLNPIIDVSGDTATARSTFCVVQQTEHVLLAPIVVGRYADTFARDEDGWYFTARQADIEMVGDLSGHLVIDPKAFT